MRKIRTIFAFISDKPELLKDPYDEAPPSIVDLKKIGYRSPLFRISKPLDGNEQVHTPIAYILHICETATALPLEDRARASMLTDFRLLTLSEKALLNAYLCHRDTVGDYSYAHTCLALGGLYISALFLIGAHHKTIAGSGVAVTKVRDIIDQIMELSKRYTSKAINLLKREREHNRNTFHLLSEASFNLGDLLLIRLAWLTDTPPEVKEKVPTSVEKGLCTLLTHCDLFGECYLIPAPVSSSKPDTAAAGADANKLKAKPEVGGEKTAEADKGACKSPPRHFDAVHEDLRRQVWEAYRQGLVFVQNEMDDYAARFRLPSDVFCAHRNVMDAVLHFRICRSARVRHCGGRYGSPDNYTPFDDTLYRKNWEEVTRQLEFFESPQRYSYYWESTMEKLITTVANVRTERSPLTVVDHKLTWARRDNLGRTGTLDMFNHVSTSPSD